MTYPHNFLRLQVGGSLYGVEQFSWSLSLADWELNSEPSTPPTEVPQGIIDAVVAFHTNTWVSNVAKIEFIKLNEIGVDGRYVSDDTTVVHDFATPVAGAGANTGTWPQLSVAVSLLTEAKRGLAHRGRFYPPAIMAVPAAGKISAGLPLTVANAATMMINAINASIPEYDVVVASGVRGGAFRRVSQVVVGDVIDTQRRRRTSIPEVYTPAASPVVSGP